MRSGGAWASAQGVWEVNFAPTRGEFGPVLPLHLVELSSQTLTGPCRQKRGAVVIPLAAAARRPAFSHLQRRHVLSPLGAAQQVAQADPRPAILSSSEGRMWRRAA